MHPFLNRDDTGQVVIRWSRIVASLIAYIVVSLAVTVVLQHFMGVRFRARMYASSTVVVGLWLLLCLHVAKRHAEGKSARQFSLSAMLAGTAGICLLLALLGSERRADSENSAHRQHLQEVIMAIVGTGTVHVANQTLVQVKRSTFDDDDLEEIGRLKTQLADVNSPLYFLDLSGTNVTDHGLATLASMDSLEFLFLERTAVTDVSIDAVETLPHIRVISVVSTVVTPERLLRLSVKRPQWNIEPKTYQRLKAR
jgi:hypothetical protein